MSKCIWHWRTGGVALAALASGACGSSPELADELSANQREPVFGAIPQRIGAIEYDRAFDSTPEVNYGAYVTSCDFRHDGVDIDRSDDPNQPCSVGWTTNGEWLEYDLSAPMAQTIDLSLRVASDLPERHVHVSVDGVNLGDRVLPRGVGWNYVTTSYRDVALGAGRHTLRVTFDSDAINLNYLELSPAASNALRVESLLPAVSAVASSLEYRELPAALAIDSDPSTRWSSAFSDPQWLSVDLGVPRSVSRVALSWETAASQSYEIDVSDGSDGPWTTVARVTNGDGGVDELVFSAVTARYVRMYSSARTTSWGNSLYDFSVYGASEDPSCISNGSAPELAPPTRIVPRIPLDEHSGPPPKPENLLQPAFVPQAIDPNQCAFGCYNGSALDGNTLVATGINNSIVYVFVKAADGTWQLEARVSNPERADTDRDRTFGALLALHGDDLLVSGTAGDTARVYVFRRSVASWNISQVLTVNASSLAIGPSAALVGTGQDARWFQKSQNGAYRLQTVFNAPAELSGRFGSTTALDADLALVGALRNSGQSSSGRVYAYERCNASFRLLQTFSPEAPLSGLTFAEALTVSDGQIAISSPDADVQQGSHFGAVELYSRQGEYFQPTFLIESPLPDDGQFRYFGSALFLKDQRLLVGYDSSYPYAASSFNLLFDVSGEPDFRAALLAGNSRRVQISGDRAVVDVINLHFGRTPALFELTQ